MLTITVIAEGDEVVAHTDPEVIERAVGGWLARNAPLKNLRVTSVVFSAFSKAIKARDYESAGIHAGRLGISLGVHAAPATQPEYLVPVDPADETNCEACQ